MIFPTIHYFNVLSENSILIFLVGCPLAVYRTLNYLCIQKCLTMLFLGTTNGDMAAAFTLLKTKNQGIDQRCKFFQFTNLYILTCILLIVSCQQPSTIMCYDLLYKFVLCMLEIIHYIMNAVPSLKLFDSYLVWKFEENSWSSSLLEINFL